METVSFCRVFAIGLLLTVLVAKTQGFLRPGVKCRGKPADIVFVLDSSSSIGETNFTKQLNFVKYMVDHLDIGLGPNQVRVGVETFSDYTHVDIDLADFTDKRSLARRIDDIPYMKGNTNIGDALNQLRSTMFRRERGSRSNVRHVAIILTDGASQDKQTTQWAARACRDTNIELFVIGIGHYVDISELWGIASEPKSTHLFQTPTYDALDQIRDDVIQRTCEAAFTAGPGFKCWGKPADIVFVLDSSSSIGETNFTKQLDFVKYMVDHLDIGLGTNQVRVGVETFSNYAQVHIDLVDSTDKTNLKRRIDYIPYLGGNTNIGDALNQLRSTMFRRDSGSRSNVRHVAIILTDGTSQDRRATQRAAKGCREANIELFVIGIGHYITYSELRGIVSEPKSKFLFQTPSYDALNQIREDVIQRACEDDNAYFL